MTDYPIDFYQRHQEGTRRSARTIVPLVLDLLRPRSVVDLGCGAGTWLSVFQEAGVEDIFGIDGEWVDQDRLEFPRERFMSADLTHALEINRHFDLVMSLEVAEHLPSDCAEAFVDSLTRLGPVVLFSAAVPHQGGKNHVNEQWPEYWADHFRKRNYIVIDALRRKIWDNKKVEWWYAQNILLFAQPSYLATCSSLKAELLNTHPSQLSLVHPKMLLEIVEWNHRLDLMVRDLCALLSPDDAFILVDQDQFRGLMAAGRRVLPFLERDGEYWGPPADDEIAIRELNRLRQSGVSFIVFAWPAFWWLDNYVGLRDHLRSNYRCVMDNSRLVAFDLHDSP